ncbi:MAG: N-acetylmuramoyl-L-alanine amidase [Oscillospiraceae bacterium]|nr:N-acetylmuramoyl-L-alanine amidase [Oscillospiraceae bacterium]
MSNSSLVTYTNISPNKTSPRTHAIDTITIHCVVGQWTAKQICDYFSSSSRQASCNYGVGKDGSIGLCVNESDRSWCSSNRTNDHRAITIETASDTSDPYAVTDAAYNALIKLVADICQRNGISQLIWSDTKSDRVNHKNGCNMTVHRDFANKACPGEYLYSRMSDIAAKVNAILASGTAATTTAATTTTSSTTTATTSTEEDDEMSYDQFKTYMTQYRKELQDNDSGTWSSDDRDWAISAGLFVGSGTTSSGDPNYMWEDFLTREQAAALFHRLATKYNLG